MSLINLRTFQSTVQGIQITRGDVRHRPTVPGLAGAYPTNQEVIGFIVDDRRTNMIVFIRSLPMLWATLEDGLGVSRLMTFCGIRPS